jgi:hypothetical protein
MKLATWNCEGAYRNKAEAIARWMPDIAVIQECESPDRLIFASGVPRPTSQLWFGDLSHPSKGLAVFSYTNFQFERIEPYHEEIRYCVPLRVTGEQSFNLLAIWTTRTAA